MTYEYIFLRQYLDNAYGVAQTSHWWKYGTETVKKYSGARVVKLLNSKYMVESGTGILGWAQPNMLDKIIESVIREYSKRTGMNISVKKIPRKTYVGVNNDKFYFNVVDYHLVSDAPLSYYVLEKLRNMVKSRLTPYPLSLRPSSTQTSPTSQRRAPVTNQPQIIVRSQNTIKNNQIPIVVRRNLPRNIKPIVMSTKQIRYLVS